MQMNKHAIPLVMSRIFNVPLMIHEPKLDVILWALKDRLNIDMDETAVQAAPEKYHLSAEAKNASRDRGIDPKNIAVIAVHDVLVNRHSLMLSYSGMTSYLYIRSAFRKAMANNDVAAVVLHIDSPGGEVAGAFETAKEIHDARGTKPIIAAIDEHAFSAGYMIASAADSIILPASGGVGSIGVIAKHIDQSGYNEKEGFKVTTIYAGARKNDSSPDQPLTEEAYGTIEGIVRHHYDIFTKEVARNRGMDEAAVRSTEAALYFGKKAIDAGLADEIGNLDDAIMAAVSASEGGANIQGKIPGKDTKMSKEVEKKLTFDELVAGYPEFAAQLREEGAKAVDIDFTVSNERERVLFMAATVFGAEKGAKFRDIIESGITPEQYLAITGTQTWKESDDTKEEKFRQQMLDQISRTNSETVGFGDGARQGYGDPKDFVGLVEAYQVAHGCTRGTAISVIAKSHPEEHQEYIRNSNIRIVRKGGE
ncbi:MAG: S49 family peptidase [Deltaproteobacteria bacterium]|nr:S49 family peptidase [Deltaproteobacteria bacterium]